MKISDTALERVSLKGRLKSDMNITRYQKGLLELCKTCHRIISGSVKGGGRKEEDVWGKNKYRKIERMTDKSSSHMPASFQTVCSSDEALCVITAVCPSFLLNVFLDYFLLVQFYSLSYIWVLQVLNARDWQTSWGPGAHKSRYQHPNIPVHKKGLATRSWEKGNQ